MKFILCLILIASLGFTSAQAQEDFEAVIRKSLEKKPRPSINLDSRNSFIASQSAKITGLKLGLDYDNTIRFGVGINFLDVNRYKPYYFKTGLNKVDTANAKLNFRYACIYTEYIFFRDKHWQFSIPVQLGFGDSYYKYGSDKLDRKAVILYEPGVSGHYKFFSWVGVGAGVGYRLMLKNNRAINKSFNSPIYEVGIRIFFKDLYTAIFKNKKGEEKKK